MKAERLTQQGGIYNQGQTVSVRAIPNQGYEFTGWSGDVSGTSNPLSITIDSNTSITAQFARIKYLLGVNVSGDGNVTQEVISPPVKLLRNTIRVQL